MSDVIDVRSEERFDEEELAAGRERERKEK